MPEEAKTINSNFIQVKMRSIVTIVSCVLVSMLTHWTVRAQTPECINPDPSINITTFGQDAVIPTTCANSNDGVINVGEISGGQAPYQCQWYRESDDYVAVTEATAGSPFGRFVGRVDGLEAGEYYLVVRDQGGEDGSSCRRFGPFFVGEVGDILNTYPVPAYDPTCTGKADGILSFTVDGQITRFDSINERQPYRLQWSNEANTFTQVDEDVMEGETVTFRNLPADKYIVVVTDAQGCQSTWEYVLNDPEPIRFDINPRHLTCESNDNGSFAIRISGGAGNSTRTKEVQVYREDPRVPNPIPNPISPLVTPTPTLGVLLPNGYHELYDEYLLSEDIYWVRVRNYEDLSPYGREVRDCNLLDTISIIQPNELLVREDVFIPSCNGGDDGSIVLTVFGGTPPYTIDWTGPNGVQNGSIEPPVDGDAIPGDDTFLRRINLESGLYDYTLTDANGCSRTSTVNLGQPEELNVMVDVTDVSCQGFNDGAARAVISGGTGDYMYRWTYGELNNPPVNESTDPEVFDLIPGTYFLTVTDENGCTGMREFTVNPSQRSVPELQIDELPVTCNGANDGGFSITVSSGTVTRYELSTGQVRLPDGTSPTTTFFDLPAGEYYVTAYDAGVNDRNCFVTDTVVITEPEAITYDINVDSVRCRGTETGSIEIVAQGGSPFQNTSFDYEYEFCYLSRIPVVCGDEDLRREYPGWEIDNNMLSQIPAGKFSIQVTDSRGCRSVIDTFDVFEPSSALKVRVDTLSVIQCHPQNAEFDSQGFSGVLRADVRNYDYPVDPETGRPVDSLTGTPPYQFFWSLPPGVPEDFEEVRSQTIGGVPAGCYEVYVIDARGCEAMATACLSNPELLTLDVAQGNAVTSCDFNDPESRTTIQLSYNGGVGNPDNYDVSWTDPPLIREINLDATEYNPFTRTISNVFAGNYRVTVRDERGCRAMDSIRISGPEEKAIVGLLVDVDEVSCNGGNDGTIRITPVGGRPNYTYNWRKVESQEEFSTGFTNVKDTLAAGDYDVIVNDADNCTYYRRVTVPEPDLIRATFDISDVMCYNQNNGSIVTTVTGGRAPYMYEWNDGDAGMADENGVFDFVNKSKGVFSLSITDNNNCTVNQQVTIEQPNRLDLLRANPPSRYEINNVSCNGANDGEIYAYPVGGTAPYEYNWLRVEGDVDEASILEFIANSYVDADANDLADDIREQFNNLDNVENLALTRSFNNDTISDLAPGRYVLVVIDGNECVTTREYEITEPDVLVFNDVTSRPTVRCGTATGSIRVDISGGNRPYEYKVWNLNEAGMLQTVASSSTVSDTVRISGIRRGDYFVTVTDIRGCTPPDTQAITVEQPETPVAFAEKVRDAICADAASDEINENDGIARGSASYESGMSGDFAFAWYIKDGSRGAPENTGDRVFLNPGNYVLYAIDENTSCLDSVDVTIGAPPALVVNLDIRQTTCFNARDAVVSARVSGGTPPYEYRWIYDDAVVSDFQDGDSILTRRIPGTYAAVVRDANGCISRDVDEVLERDIILTDVSDIAAPTCLGDCNGFFDIVVSGGTNRYVLSLITSEGDTIRQLRTEDGVPINFRNLCADRYEVYVQDYEVDRDNDTTYVCEKSTDFVTVPDGPRYSVQFSGLELGCANTPTTVSVALFRNGFEISENDFEDFRFDWTGGLRLAAPNEREFTPSMAGTYALTVTDENGCNETFEFDVVDQAFDPSAAGRNCGAPAEQGELVINANGGSAPYEYTVTGPDGFNQVFSNRFTNEVILEGLAPGSYGIIGVDGTGCTAGPVTAVISNVAFDAVVEVQKNVSCNGGADGAARVDVVGGSTPYSYTWSHDPFLTSPDANNLPASSASNQLFVTIKDGTGCSVTRFFSVSEPDAPLIPSPRAIEPTACEANDGAIELTVVGGVPPYTYLWTKEGDMRFEARSKDISNLGAGTYNVVVTDEAGCVQTVTVILSGPEGPQIVNAVVEQLTCANTMDASIDITVLGGAQPYSFEWSNGATTEDIDNLDAGSYVGTITDANGCVTVSDAVVIEEVPAIELLDVNTTAVSECGAEDGSITVGAVTGGIAPYTIRWTRIGGVATGSETGESATFEGLPSGFYRLAARENGGNFCEGVDTIYVGQPSSLSAETEVNGISCNEEGLPSLSDGSIEVFATGGVTPYEYAWSNGETTARIENLDAGTYFGTVTDAEGCYYDVWGTVIEPDPIMIADATIMNVTCNGADNGMISVEIAGGTPPYDYNWETLDNDMIPGDETIMNLAPGFYVGNITDANGCTFTSPVVEITEPEAIMLMADVSPADCETNEGGEILLTVQGGSAPYMFMWSNGEETQDLVDVEAGEYAVTVTDDNGCMAMETFEVTQDFADERPTIQVTGSLEFCVGDEDGVLLDAGEGYEGYLWSDGEESQANLINPETAGEYILYCTVITACGEVNTDTVIVNVLDAPVKPVIAFDVESNTLTATGNEDIDVSYQWGAGDTLISGANEMEYVAQVTGNYFVVVTAGDGSCSAVSDTFVVDTLSSRSGLREAKALTMYPNPTNSVLNINADWNTAQAEVSVYNQLGQRVIFEEVNTASDVVTLNLENLASGVYSIRVISNGQTWTGKVVKQ